MNDSINNTSLPNHLVNISKQQLMALIENDEIDFLDVPSLAEKWNYDKDIIFCFVKRQQLYVLSSLPGTMLNDPDFALDLIKTHYKTFYFLPSIHQSNREIALAVVDKEWNLLEKFSDEIRKDKEVVTTAIKADLSSFEHAHPVLQADREFVQFVMTYNPHALYFASQDLQKDISFLQTLRNYGPFPSTEKWYDERMRTLSELEILEDEAWMKNNTPKSSLQTKTKKF